MASPLWGSTTLRFWGTPLRRSPGRREGSSRWVQHRVKWTRVFRPCSERWACLQPGVPAFTVRQPEDAMAVLRDRARETGVSVRYPSFSAVGFHLALELTPVSTVPVSSAGVSRAGRVPKPVRTSAPGPGRAAPALQRLSGHPAEPHLAAEAVPSRWSLPAALSHPTSTFLRVRDVLVLLPLADQGAASSAGPAALSPAPHVCPSPVTVKGQCGGGGGGRTAAPFLEPSLTC